MNQKIIAVSSIAALLLGSSSVFAHEAALDGGDIAIEGASSSAFAATGGGNAIITGLGECLQLGGYSEDSTNDACEGREGPAEEPEPEVAEAPKAPEAPKEPIVSIATLGGKALFDTNADTLNSEGEQALADLIVQLEKFQEITVMYVTGHTDSRGSEAYNQQLSERRAETVASYLRAAYPDVKITSQGMGESVPRETNSTAEGRAANRRVEVQITAKSVTQS